MLLSTENIQDLKISEYIGVVTGSSIRGSGVTKDFFSKITDFWGGKATGYKQDFDKAMLEALQEMISAATQKGADAVIGIKTTISVIHMERGGLFICCAIGTAVKIEHYEKLGF